MCVIMIAEDTRPTPEMIDKAYEKNPVGAGIAWREKEYVRWKKGLELAELQDLVAKLPLPFIAHCRIDTIGGDSKELTHPFAVSTASPLVMNGRTKGYMMFHNGTWHTWKDKLFDVAVRSNIKLPGGRWSDSRAMAFVAAIYGITALELIDEKSAVLSPEDLQAFGSGWAKIDGIWCSNRLWESAYVTHNYSQKREEAKLNGNTEIKVVVKTEAKAGGLSPQETFCRNNSTVQREEDWEEGVEASPQSLRRGHETLQETFPELSSGESSKLDQLIKEGTKAIEEVRQLNPSKFRRPLTPDSLDRELRQENARKGITVIGRL